jgi:hypothetical protein
MYIYELEVNNILYNDTLLTVEVVWDQITRLNVYVQCNGGERHNPTSPYLDLFIFYCINLR